MWLAENHGDALAYELLNHGLRLTGPYRNCSVEDAYVVAVNAPPGSPLAVAIDPAAEWTRTDHWLSSIEYSLRWLVWAKTKDGQHNRRRPKPIRPPRQGNASRSQEKRQCVKMSKEQLQAFFDLPRIPLAAEETVVHSTSSQPATQGAPRQ